MRPLWIQTKIQICECKDEWIRASHLSQSFTHKFVFFSRSSPEQIWRPVSTFCFFPCWQISSPAVSLSLWAPGGIWLSHHSSGWISIIPLSHHSLLCFSSRGEHILYLDTCDLMPHTCTLTHAQAVSIYLCFSTSLYFIQYRYQVRAESCPYIRNRDITYNNIS